MWCIINWLQDRTWPSLGSVVKASNCHHGSWARPLSGFWPVWWFCHDIVYLTSESNPGQNFPRTFVPPTIITGGRQVSPSIYHRTFVLQSTVTLDIRSPAFIYGLHTVFVLIFITSIWYFTNNDESKGSYFINTYLSL